VEFYTLFPFLVCPNWGNPILKSKLKHDQAGIRLFYGMKGFDRNLLTYFRRPVQTNGADGFKLALYLIYRGLEGVDARIVHKTQHDEIIVEARDTIEEQVEAIVKESMEEALDRLSLRSLLWLRSEWLRPGDEIRSISNCVATTSIHRTTR
jgi:hypothetical protein